MQSNLNNKTIHNYVFKGNAYHREIKILNAGQNPWHAIKNSKNIL